jgi:hypothetical protein
MSDIIKIGGWQLSRAAYIYLRQSSAAQVESTIANRRNVSMLSSPRTWLAGGTERRDR